MKLRRLLPVLALSAALLPMVAPPAGAAAPSLTVAGEYQTPAMPQWASSSPPELFAGATVGDVSGDGKPDVVAGYQNGHVYAWHANGTRFLDLTTPGSGSVRSTPVLVDLNKDGRLDILGSNQAGYVYAFDGTGRRFFTVRTTAYHTMQAVFAAPVAADVTGDGVLEIIATGWDHYLWVWDLAGRNKPGFPLFMADTIWSSPVIADLNRDGRRDIVFGYDCDGASGSRCYGRSTNGGGFVTAIGGNARVLSGWPRFIPGQTVWSTPAVYDLNGDGRLEVVVGMGLWNPAPYGTQVNAFDATGRPVPGWPVRTRGRVFASPAVGDVNGDGRPEVSVMDEKNYIYLWDQSGHLVSGWPKCSSNNGTCNSTAHASTVIADVTGDGVADVVAAGQQTVRAYNRAGSVLMSARAPSGVSGTSAPPAVAEINGQATVLLSAMHRQSNGSVTGTVVRFTSGVPLGPAPWPMFRQNPRGTGRDDVAPTTPVVTATATSPTAIRVSATSSDSGSGVAGFDIWFRDNGGEMVRWLNGTAPNSRVGTSATHTRTVGAVAGHSYRFYARARDRGGNWTGFGVVDVVAPG